MIHVNRSIKIAAIRYLMVVGACVLLAGCASRAAIVPVPEDGQITQLETVFVATTREPEPDTFGTARNDSTSFVRYDVSVPADRSLGTVPVSSSSPDPERHFLIAGREDITDEASLLSAINAELAARPTGQRDLVVYVHGYNNTFAQSLYRTAQMRTDYEIPGLAVHFAWPSAENVAGYVYDRDSVLASRDALESFLKIVGQAEAEHVILVAHSMGSLLTMETLRAISIGGGQRALEDVYGVVLMSPDIDIDVFRAQVARIQPFPESFVVTVSQRDRALRLSATISNRPDRLGNIADIEEVADLPVTFIDVTEFGGGEGDGLSHNTAASSPAMIEIVRRAHQVDAAFQDDPSARAGLVPGTVRTVRSATQVVLSPIQTATGL